MDLKERIKHTRKLAHLSQSQMAQLLGLSLMTIRRWETGEISPRFNEIQQLSKVLNTSVEYLVGLSDNPRPNVMHLAQLLANDDIDLQKTITAGISKEIITVKDENTNMTYTFPNNEEGRKTLAMLMTCSQRQGSQVFANSISGDNNNGNNLGIVQD